VIIWRNSSLLKWHVLMTIFFRNQHEVFLQHVLCTLPKSVVLAQRKCPQDMLLVYTTNDTEHGSVTCTVNSWMWIVAPKIPKLCQLTCLDTLKVAMIPGIFPGG
jgi:hypothetical protein